MCTLALRQLRKLCSSKLALGSIRGCLMAGAFMLLVFVPCAGAIGQDVPAGASVSVEHGRLSGKVADPTDAVIPDALVTITSVKGGVEKRTETDKVGRFQFQDLPTGQYTISIMREGFAEFHGKVALTAGKLSVTLDARMKIA